MVSLTEQNLRDSENETEYRNRVSRVADFENQPDSWFGLDFISRSRNFTLEIEQNLPKTWKIRLLDGTEFFELVTLTQLEPNRDNFDFFRR